MTVKEMVRFGIKNGYYAPYDETSGKFTTPKRIPGMVALSLSAEGDSSTFYADDKAYYTVSSNGGYTGNVEIAAIPDDMLVDCLGYIKDANGVLLEDASAVAKPFALLFEVDSNIEPTRFALYNCTMTRPGNEHNTKSESSDVDTQTFDVTCIARTMTYGDGTASFVKGYLPLTTETKEKYEAWFTDVYLPVKASA